MSKPITQAEARKYRALANKLEGQIHQMFRSWGRDYPEGICIGSVDADAVALVRVGTARALRHAVVVTQSEGRLYFHALPQPKDSP